MSQNRTKILASYGNWSSKRKNPFKFTVTKSKCKNITCSPQHSRLHHFVSYRIASVVSRDAVIIKSQPDELDYIDPLELVVKGDYDKNSQEYIYRISLRKYQHVIQEFYERTTNPFGFIALPKVEEYHTMVTTLANAKDQYHIKLKNEMITFDDHLGYGIFRIYPDVSTIFAANSFEMATNIELTSIFKDIVREDNRNDNEARTKLIVALMNKLLTLKKCTRAAIQYKKYGKPVIEYVDWQFATEIVLELKNLYKNIIEPYMNILTPSSKGDSPSNPHFEAFKKFNSLCGNLFLIEADSLIQGEDILTKLSEYYQEISWAVDAVPQIVGHLFSNKDTPKKIRDGLKNLKSKSVDYYRKVIKDVKTINQKGYVWRQNVYFFRMFKNQVLQYALKKAHCLQNIVRLGAPSPLNMEHTIYIAPLENNELRIERNQIQAIKHLKDRQFEVVQTLKFANVALTSSDCVKRVGNTLIMFMQKTVSGYEEMFVMNCLTITPDHFAGKSILKLVPTERSFFRFTEAVLNGEKLAVMCEGSMEQGSLLQIFDVHQSTLDMEEPGITSSAEVHVHELEKLSHVAEPKEPRTARLRRSESMIHVSQRIKFLPLPNNSLLVQLLMVFSDLKVYQQLTYLSVYKSGNVEAKVQKGYIHRAGDLQKLASVSNYTVMFEPKDLKNVRGGIVLPSKHLSFFLVLLWKNQFICVSKWRQSQSLLQSWGRLMRRAYKKEEEEVVDDNEAHPPWIISRWNSQTQELRLITSFRKTAESEISLAYRSFIIKQ